MDTAPESTSIPTVPAPAVPFPRVLAAVEALGGTLVSPYNRNLLRLGSARTRSRA